MELSEEEKARIERIHEQTLRFTKERKNIYISPGEWIIFDPKAWGVPEILSAMENTPLLKLHPFLFFIEERSLPSAFSIKTGLPQVVGISFPEEEIWVDLPSDSGYYLILPEKLGGVYTEVLSYLKGQKKFFTGNFEKFEIKKTMQNPEVRATLALDRAAGLRISASLDGEVVKWLVSIPNNFSEEEKEELRSAINFVNKESGDEGLNLIPTF